MPLVTRRGVLRIVILYLVGVVLSVLVCAGYVLVGQHFRDQRSAAIRTAPQAALEGGNEKGRVP